MMYILYPLSLILSVVGLAKAQNNDTASASYTDSYTPSERSQWTTEFMTESGVTTTIVATTVTLSAGTTAVYYYAPENSYAGVGRQPESYETIQATTITVDPTTITVAPYTVSDVVPPDNLYTQVLPQIIGDLAGVAPTLTSLSESQASKLNVAYQSFISAYTSASPVPTAAAVLASAINNLLLAGGASDWLVASIDQQLYADQNSAWATSVSSVFSSLLSPYPTLSSQVAAYMSAAAPWYDREYVQEISVVTSVLGITTLPTSEAAVLSTYSSIGAQGSHNAAAAPTPAASVLVNAGVAAIGMVVVGLL